MAVRICHEAEQVQKDQRDMSLLEEAFEEFTIINKAQVDDGYGGIVTTWTDGATVSGAMVYNDSNEMRVAQALGSTSTYTFTCRRSLQFDFHDVLRRNSDGQLFRITTNSDEKKTPGAAGLDMRQYDAEQLNALPR